MTVYETASGRVEIRELARMSEMVAAEQVQIQVWGSDVTPHPKEILIPIQHEGGLLAGAFAGDQLISLIFGFPTRQPACLHSQLLATLPDWRGLGIGAQLKWFQRSWCLERGIRLVRWTVDPLRAANAALNIHRLGGLASTYYPDYYGVMQGIDAGAPTDRLLVEWPLDHPRVNERAERVLPDLGFSDAQPANQVMAGRPVLLETNPNCPRIRIALPDDFIHLSKANPPLAQEWRLQTRALFTRFFAAGYQITEFTRTPGPAYLLELRQPEMQNPS